jgi:DNA-directed RNA polymerase alpha subunit
MTEKIANRVLALVADAIILIAAGDYTKGAIVLRKAAGQLDEIDDAPKKIDPDTLIKDALPQLPMRVYNTLARAGIRTVEDLTNKSEWEMVAIQNMGRLGMSHLKEEMAKADLEFTEYISE